MSAVVIPIRPGAVRAVVPPVDPVASVFGPGGLLARQGKELRDGQRTLAQAIHETITDGGALLAEGPCGTGKSLAYLVPAIHSAVTRGGKVVVATANIALQEQLVQKDLPYLQGLLPTGFTFALQKGLSNYLCLYQQNNCDGYPETAEDVSQLRAIDLWADTTTTGDKSELPFVPTDGVWRLRSIEREDCLGKHCPNVDDCFARRARQRAQDADIIVTNHHTLAAHVNLFMEYGAEVVLPKWDTLVVDEAHELSDIAREFFGAHITRGAVRRLVSWLAPRGDAPVDAALAARLTAAWDHLWLCAEELHRARTVADPNGPAVVKAPWVDASDVLAVLDQVADLARKHSLARADRAETEDDKIARQRAANVERRASKLHGWIDAITAADDPDFVFWLAPKKAGRFPATVTLEARPLDVASILRDHLWGRSRASVATSATLTTGRGVDGWTFARRQLGFPDAVTGGRAVAVESPFDFKRQAVLCIPRGMPHPTEARDAFDVRLSKHLRELVDAARGRTLGLFTSLRMVGVAARALQGCEHTVLAQGDLPRTALVEAFKADPSSVLLGTKSLWTGVDVQGEACVAVLIDRIPFPQRTDPVIVALCERAELLSGDKAAGFREEMLPRAVLALRQGVGRLIRSRSDWGAVVICDGRLLSAAWGRKVVGALGLPTQVGDMAEVGRWFGEREGGEA